MFAGLRRSTKKGWMSGPISVEVLNDQLHHEIKAYCKAENIDFKILLVLDNAPEYPPLTDIIETHKCFLFPSNTTLLLQPIASAARSNCYLLLPKDIR
jgi:hypothetical protein